jgi:hypothetical protein
MLNQLQHDYLLTVECTARHFRPISLFAIAGVLLMFACPATSKPSEQLGEWRWSNVERVVVIPDIHGAYLEFTELLKASGVINTSLQWIAGQAHLVSLGDLLDRGEESRKVMDLLMRLQEEAFEDGGRVHVVAGNHETMNLQGDLRYVSTAEFAAYSDIESTEDRKQVYAEYVAHRSESIALSFLRGGPGAIERDPKTQRKFEELYPPGYFGHRKAFSPEGRYGRWLLSLPAMIVIDRTVFVHGGLPAVTATASLDELNQRYHTDLRRFFELRYQLINAGALLQDSSLTNRALARRALRVADPSSCPREERAACARERGGATDPQRSPTAETVAALRELVELENSSMLGPTGPLWYRGSVRCKDALEIPVLQAALTNLGADRVVVGHTPTTDRRVHRMRNDKLIMLDTGMLTSHYQGRPAALIIEEDNLEVQYLNPTERVTPLGDGGNGVYPLSNDQLRRALRSGGLREVKKGWFGTLWNIELEYQGVRLEALFFPADIQGVHKRELAAYLLDEMLGFGLVPITVIREITNEPGVLQLAYPDFITEPERKRQRIDTSRWCSLPMQQLLLEVFDLLIGNTDRSGSSVGYARPLWNLEAFGHGDAFSSLHTLPDSSEKLVMELPQSVREALLSLDEASLSQSLGEQLEDEQIAALLARRDAILQIMKHPAESYGHSVRAAMDGRRQ